MIMKFKPKDAVKPSSSEPTYDVAAFSAQFGLPAGEAQTIIKRYGPSRKKIDAYMAARKA